MIAKVSLDFLARKNFLPNEFFESGTADLLGIDNYVIGIEALNNLIITADLAQEIRDLIKFPVVVTSGYRCPELNTAVGSKSTSKHIQGLALDFKCNHFGKPELIVKFLHENNLLVDVCLIEDGWIHVSRLKDNNRGLFGYWDITKRRFTPL